MEEVKKKILTVNKKKHIFCFLMIGFFIAHWCFFWLYANLNSIRLAFTEYNFNAMSHEMLPADRFFENFVAFFSDLFAPRGAKYLLNGVIFQLIQILLLPLNYMIAFLIYKKVPGSEAYKIIMYIPHVVSAMVISLLTKYGVERGFASIYAEVTGNTFPYVFTDVKYDLLAIVIYQLFFGTTINLVVLGSMARIPEDLVEYGQLEGLSMWQEFIYLTIPLLCSVLQVQCLGMFVGFFTNQGPLYDWYGGGAPENIRTFGYYLFVAVFGGTDGVEVEYMYGYTCAANLSIGLLSIPIVQLTKKLFDKFSPEAEY